MTECAIKSTNQVGYRFSGQPMIGKINPNPTNHRSCMIRFSSYYDEFVNQIRKYLCLHHTYFTKQQI